MEALILQALEFSQTISILHYSGIVLLLFVALCLKRAFLSPLRHIPGPWLCKISDLPAIIIAIKGAKSPWAHSLFEKYGNVVRTGPTTIAFNSVDSMKMIYGNAWEKGTFYDGLEIGSRMHLLGVRIPAEASKRRKAIMPTFSTANLRETTPMIHSYINKFTAQIEAAQENEGSVDVFRWYRLLAFDIIAELAFNHKFKMLESGKKAQIVDLVHSTMTHGVARSIIPGLDLFINLFGTKSARDWKNAQDVLGDMGTELLRDHLEKPVEERGSAILSTFNAHYKASGISSTEVSYMVASESAALLIAGSDTTSMTLVYLTYLMGVNLDIQKKLQAELDSHFSDRDYLPFVNELDRLPYLNAVIKEIIRLQPAVPGDLPRKVPKGGSVLENYALPVDTTVFCQSYSINRLEHIFGKDAGEFNPDRYLNDNETPEMKAALFSFSVGPRNCAGMNLAYAELKIITAYVFRRYNITLAAETTPESMAPKESFFTAPISMQTRVHMSLRS